MRQHSLQAVTASQSSLPVTASLPRPALQLQASKGNQATNRAIELQSDKLRQTSIRAKPLFQGLSIELSGSLSHLDTPIQAKLAIGQPNDQYEREADRIARQVVNESRQPATQAASISKIRPSTPDRPLSLAPTLQASSAGDQATALPNLEANIQQAQGRGRSLPEHTQASMEQAFGADFSQVRIHADTQADQLNRSLNSYAFTHRQDIFFRRGMYEPDSLQGKALLAHELTHALQQRYTSAPQLQKFSIKDKPARWGDAKRAVLSSTGGTGVAFIYDTTPNPLVVKATDDPIGETFLASSLHQKVSGTAAVETRVASSEEKLLIPDVVEILVDWQAAAQKIGAAPADLQEAKVKQFRKAPKIYVMGKAEGEDFGDITKNNPDTVKSLLQNPSYLQKIGMIHAVDLFLGNSDRFDMGNFGNWMTDSQEKIMLLDNFDANSSASTFSTFRNHTFDVEASDPSEKESGVISPVKQLAPSQLQSTAEHVVAKFYKQLNPNYSFAGWLDQPKQQFMAMHIKKGLQTGRDKLISTLAPTFGKRSRSIKQEVMTREGGLGGEGWKNIKARAKYVKNLR